MASKKKFEKYPSEYLLENLNGGFLDQESAVLVCEILKERGESIPSSIPVKHKEITSDIYKRSAELVKKGYSIEELKNELAKSGLNAESANEVVKYLITGEKSKTQGEGIKKMSIGVLFFVGGCAVTAITYSAAAAGGTYVIASGAILFGIMKFIQGLTEFRL